MATGNITLGVIGGSGVYKLEALEDVKEIEVDTPFGKPSDNVISGKLNGREIFFLPRHGRGHYLTPTSVNYRANIYALKSLGVNTIVGVSAVGSLKEELKPRDFVIPSQIFDRTSKRVSTFFDTGLVAHVTFDKPYCPSFSDYVYDQAVKAGASVHRGGTYVCMEGPQFSTVSESKIYRGFGFDVIGMTNIPEAKLAREAEICYSSICLVTDYDVWKEGEEVNVEAVLATIRHNVELVKKMLAAIIDNVDSAVSDCACRSALAGAIQTSRDKIDPKMAEKLELLVGKYIKG